MSSYFSLLFSILGRHKKLFIPGLIGPFLEVTLIPKEGKYYTTLMHRLQTVLMIIRHIVVENCLPYLNRVAGSIGPATSQLGTTLINAVKFILYIDVLGAVVSDLRCLISKIFLVM